MKKARAWLDAAGVAYHFHDYRKEGVAQSDLRRWCDALGWDKVLNRAGTTWRKLPEAERQAMDEAAAIAAMLVQPAMIKRPILEGEGVLMAGFKPERYQQGLAG